MMDINNLLLLLTLQLQPLTKSSFILVLPASLPNINSLARLQFRLALSMQKMANIRYKKRTPMEVIGSRSPQCKLLQQGRIRLPPMFRPTPSNLSTPAPVTFKQRPIKKGRSFAMIKSNNGK